MDINKRQEINKEILKNLAFYVEKYPGMRFSQILYNFGFVTGIKEKNYMLHWKDEYVEEPDIVLQRLGDFSDEQFKKK